MAFRRRAPDSGLGHVGLYFAEEERHLPRPRRQSVEHGQRGAAAERPPARGALADLRACARRHSGDGGRHRRGGVDGRALSGPGPGGRMRPPSTSYLFHELGDAGAGVGDVPPPNAPAADGSARDANSLTGRDLRPYRCALRALQPYRSRPSRISSTISAPITPRSTPSTSRGEF